MIKNTGDGPSSARTIAALVFVLSAGLAVPFIRCLGTPDEGALLTGAYRLSIGEIPYTDFFEFIPPGNFYVYKWIFDVFGLNIIAAKCVFPLIAGGIALIIYALAVPIMGKRRAALPAFLYALCAVPLWPESSHHWPATLAYLAAVLALSKGMPLAGGILGGVCALFLQHSGILLVAAWTVYCVIRGGKLISCLIGFFVTTGAGLFLMQGATADALESQFLWPLQNYTDINSLPYAYDLKYIFRLHPTDSIAKIYIAFIPIGAAIAAVRLGRPAILYAITGFSLFLTAWPRPDIIHIAWASPVLFILFSAYLFTLKKAGKAIILFLLVIFGLSAIVRIWDTHKYTVKVEGRGGALWMREADAAVFKPAVQLIQSRIPEEGYALFYPYSPVMYLLTRTRNPTRHNVMVPGLQTVAQFRSAREDLARRRVPLAFHYPWYRGAEKELFPRADTAIFIHDPIEELLSGWDTVAAGKAWKILKPREGGSGEQSSDMQSP